MKKASKIIFSLIIITFIVLAVIQYMRFSTYMAKGYKNVRDSFDPTTEIGKAALKMKLQVDHYFGVVNMGDELTKIGRYDLAIVKYKEAIDLCKKYDINMWSPKLALSEAYEYAGQYDLALQELDWLISEKPREEIFNLLVARRNAVEAAAQGNLVLAATLTGKAYELSLENTRQFYLRECAHWPKDKALKHVEEKIAQNEELKRYYEHWKHLESLATGSERSDRF